MQLIAYWLHGHELYSSSSADYPKSIDISFIFDKYPLKSENVYVARILVDVPNDIDIMSYAIPFSYAAEDDQTILICDSVNYNNPSVYKSSLLPQIDIMQEEEIFMLSQFDLGFRTVLYGGTSGLLCTVYFTKLSDGTPNDIKVVSTARGLYPLLITDVYKGVNGVSKLIPMISSTIPGDANCDGRIDISDAVWILMYLYTGGPAPGECF